MLTEIAAGLRESRGLAYKRDLVPVMQALAGSFTAPWAQDVVPLGDDCAVIPDGDGYLLLAIEGFLNEFVAADPWFAGYCGVMVNASDIYAMGGRPTAVVDAVWAAGHERCAPILNGLAAGSRVYGIPVVGGHSNSRGGTPTKCESKTEKYEKRPECISTILRHGRWQRNQARPP